MKEFKYNIKILLRKKELYYCIIGVLLINAIHVILVINHYSPNMILKTGEYQFILYSYIYALAEKHNYHLSSVKC